MVYGGHTFREHLRCLNVVFNRLQASGLRISIAKCMCFMISLTYLGFEVSSEGIRPCEKNIERLLKAPLETKADFQSFVGMCGFYRSHMKNYASMVQPLYNYVKEKGTATNLLSAAKEVAEKVKQILTTYPLLIFLIFLLAFI